VFSTLLKRLTYANVTATLALFVALSGGAYAAAKIPPNSVGTAQLKDNAVTTEKVYDGSLLAADFKAGQLPAGGVSGLEAIYGDSGGGPASVKSVEAHCPPGKKVSGGGHIITGATNARVTVSTPGQVPNPTSWYVEAEEPTPTDGSWTLYAYAICVNATSG
jgi:hypothetical protein